MWNVPSHITSGIVTMVGDVTSLARFQQTCVMAQAMILDPTTWSERNPGVICSRAIEEDWFRRGSHLALALAVATDPQHHAYRGNNDGVVAQQGDCVGTAHV